FDFLEEIFGDYTPCALAHPNPNTMAPQTANRNLHQYQKIKKERGYAQLEAIENNGQPYKNKSIPYGS
ncbi:MAG: hypothetical protein ACO3SY_08165, partial [Flavobacteriaceae bacterium]